MYLVKVLSHLGKVYVSDNHVSFKNRLVGVRARAIIPINQISKVEVGYRYGFNSAMTLTTVDREEILFDFHTHDSCVKCSELITSMLSVEPKPSLSRSTTILDDIQHYEHHVATNLETCIQILILDDTLEPAVAKKHAKMSRLS